MYLLLFYKINEKALRETQTLRSLAVVRFGHRPPARCKHIRRQDRLQYSALQLASAQCTKRVTLQLTVHWVQCRMWRFSFRNTCIYRDTL